MGGDLRGPCSVCGAYWEDSGIPECWGHCPKHMEECRALRQEKILAEAAE